jgi:ornithine cyclodeaminase/alanine dehydrogenase-like protein (mu-crystallin family)
MVATPDLQIVEELALRQTITTTRAVEVIRQAFHADGEGRTRVPPAINLDIPGYRGEFHVKTAHQRRAAHRSR